MSGRDTPKGTLLRSFHLQLENSPLVLTDISHLNACCKGRIKPAVVSTYSILTGSPDVGPWNKTCMNSWGISRRSLYLEFTFTARLVANVSKNDDFDQPFCREMQICFNVI